MQFRIGKPCSRRLWLALAFFACLMHVLACALPSLVVCHKADRPPRLEFFSDSCSCFLEETHSCADQDAHGIPCVGEACTDIHLKSYILVTARSCGLRTSLSKERRISDPEQHASAFAFFSLRPLPEISAMPKAASPPPLSCSISRLRC